MLLEKGNFKEAIQIYNQAIKYNLDKPELYYNLGIAYTRINEFSLAKECYQKTVEIDSNMYNAYYRLGQIALLYRDIEQAESFFAQSIDGEVEGKSYYQLAKINIMKNKKDKAIMYINKAIENDEKYYAMTKDEPIFLPIKKEIIEPKKEENMQKIKESKKEKIISEYLDDTYNLTKLMNNKKNK